MENTGHTINDLTTQEISSLYDEVEGSNEMPSQKHSKYYHLLDFEGARKRASLRKQ